MSKTLKTDPYWVKMRKGTTSFEPFHDHSTGDCDLPEEPTPPDGSTNCIWSFVWSGNGECGCRTCTEHHERRKRRKHSRREAKKLLHEVTRDLDMADEVPSTFSTKAIW